MSADRTYFLPPMGPYSMESANRLRGQILRNIRLTPHASVVTMDYRTVTRNHQTGQTQLGWRRVRVVVAVDRGYLTDQERNAWIKDQIRAALEGPAGGDVGAPALSGQSGEDTNVWLDPNTGEPDFRVQSVQELMDEETLRYELGIELEDLRTLNQNALFADHEWYADQHRSFRYMIKGCDMNTLGTLLPDLPVTEETEEEEGMRMMCAYRMLRDRNTPGPCQCGVPGPTPKVFRPEKVLDFMKERFGVQSWMDGLSSDQIQAHAIQHRYPHLAMDLSRSVLNFHYPAKRHKHHKSIVYVVTGDHCQPIVDEEIVNSIMKSIPETLGQRQVTTMDTGDNLESSMKSTTSATNVGSHGVAYRKRSRVRTQTPLIQVDLQTGNNNFSPEIEEDVDRVDDGLEEDEEEEKTKNKKALVLPMLSDTDRFHCYTKAEILPIIEEKCHPDFVDPATPIHVIQYYITTDTDDVNHVYHYLVRKCGVDPMKYARSYNGVCTLVRTNNIHWVACRHFDMIRNLHQQLCPSQPLRMRSVGTYAMHQFRCRVAEIPGGGTIHDLMSHYSPNLQRLADVRNHYNHAKILMKTFQPPYSNPKEGLPVTTLIPMSQRRRIDFLRSYTSVLRSLDVRDMDTIPLHHITDRVVAYDVSLHATIPCGHYAVRIPSEEEIGRLDAQTQYEWSLWSCFHPGSTRLMTHRLLKGLINRGLLTTEHIQWVCTTDPERQKRYGMLMVVALQNYIDKMYENATTEEQRAALKPMVNQLVGCSNGTTLPRLGGRLLFRSLQHLWQLIVGNIGRDQMQRLRILHTHGFDIDWQCKYNYYELDTSGLSYRALHVQPLWNVVLEQQALNVFDVARTIPRDHLIQINVDAIEYKVPDIRTVPWYTTIENNTVRRDVLDALSPQELITGGYLDGGRYKEEWPKVEAQAHAYYREVHVPERAKVYDVIERPIEDTENYDVVADWKGSLRPIVNDLEAWWTALDVDEDYSGCMVTGPAGTGKTRALRWLVEKAQNRGDRVILSAYTHAACVQMGPEAQTLSSLFGVPVDYMARQNMSAICQRTMVHIRCDWLIIDEISLIPLNILEVLMLFHRMHSQTRIVLVGDFNQLPPIESRRGFQEDFDYFSSTDIFPYLCYDRRRNIHGHWLQLTKCHRTDDPLLKTIAENPYSVVDIAAEQFPMLPAGSEMWRFLALDNRQRKACNFYCMVRYAMKYPLNAKVALNLRDLWVEDQWQRYTRKHTDVDADTEAKLREQWQAQFDGTSSEKTIYRPSHWQYLQSYTYVVGMPVACRHTIREWKAKRTDVPVCVNNRRAHIIDIDPENREMVLRWDDEVERHENREDILETLDVRIKYYDFA
ncbi:MAG: AAA family ATPase, partial [Planctomycetes bacterium]|nr:AAA family ATPase [Planctomycetota bacterium]